MKKLLDGWICCSKKNEVVHSIEKLLDLKPDVLFIELTGVANPEEVADSLTEPSLINRVYIEKMITVIDAENVLSYNSIFESDRELVQTTRRQIEVADLLLVNKIDLISEAKKNKISKLISKLNTTATLSYVTYSNIDLSSLFQCNVNDSPPVKIRIQGSHHEAAAHTHNKASFSRIKSITLQQPSANKAKEIKTFLKKWKDSLVRAKGYVALVDGTYLMQHVMNRLQWERTDYQGDHYLVLIGIDLDEQEIKKEWEHFVQQLTPLTQPLT